MRAIISVWDKTGVVDLAKQLADLGVEIFSTGGTMKALSEANVPVRSVSDLTGFPEIMDGRVKTLHPAVHGGILARRDVPSHLQQLAEHGIGLIDMVVVNLYPFVQTISKPNVTLEEAVENIDIGGPTMIRSAAKNFEDVLVLVEPKDYAPVLEQLRADGRVDGETRKRLAATAFQHVASYDTHIAEYLRPAEELFPEKMSVDVQLMQTLRYGENPHQAAAFYRDMSPCADGASVVAAKQLQGKELSFNNILDADAALSIVQEYSAPCVAILKHNNPCGLSCAENLVEAYDAALKGDPVAAYGGIVGVNRPVDEALAKAFSGTFFEVIIAPEFSEAALQVLSSRANMRLLAVGDLIKGTCREPIKPELDWKRVSGGFLMQTPDAPLDDDINLSVVTERRPTLDEVTNLLFAWKAVKHVKSNAIVLARNMALVGVGAGQMSRVDSVEIAVKKAKDRALGTVLASDAFFPFPDGVEVAAKAGVKAIIQPGGSVHDDDAIAMANKHKVAMVFTGQRHFKH
jgi:phosphoribosylaminoimidazolecarboxamide formyltransferase / IMP cyclohydrolase